MWPFKRKQDVAGAASVRPPVDLNTPVTNPGLVSAIDSFSVDDDEPQLHRLLTELNNAIYLVATLLDESDLQPTDTPSQILLPEGCQIKLITASDDDGNEMLPLFTDWEAIRSWLPEATQTLVMPARDAWALALQDYQGVVINPAGTCLPLTRSQLEGLKRVSSSV